MATISDPHQLSSWTHVCLQVIFLYSGSDLTPMVYRNFLHPDVLFSVYILSLTNSLSLSLFFLNVIISLWWKWFGVIKTSKWYRDKWRPAWTANSFLTLHDADNVSRYALFATKVNDDTFLPAFDTFFFVSFSWSSFVTFGRLQLYMWVG